MQISRVQANYFTNYQNNNIRIEKNLILLKVASPLSPGGHKSGCNLFAAGTLLTAGQKHTSPSPAFDS